MFFDVKMIDTIKHDLASKSSSLKYQEAKTLLLIFPWKQFEWQSLHRFSGLWCWYMVLDRCHNTGAFKTFKCIIKWPEKQESKSFSYSCNPTLPFIILILHKCRKHQPNSGLVLNRWCRDNLVHTHNSNNQQIPWLILAHREVPHFTVLPVNLSAFFKSTVKNVMHIIHNIIAFSHFSFIL